MAGINSSCPDIINTSLIVKTGRRTLLFGTTPGGRNIVSTVKKKEVIIVNTKTELNETISTSNSENNNGINSIIIVACPGDKVSEAKDIYTIATNIKVLITTIIIHDSCCMPINNFSSLPDLRASSDMLIITSDKYYLEYMLDCLS